MTPHDFGAPTLCFAFQCDYNRGMSVPSHREAGAGNGIQGHPCRISVLSSPETIPPAGPLRSAALHRLCFVCMVWGLSSLCLFLRCHRNTGFSTLPLPPFSTSSHLPWPFPSPVTVYIVSHSVSTSLRHRYGLLPARSPSTLTPRNRAPLPLCSLSCADVLTLCRIFHYSLKLGRLRPN